MSRTGQQRLDAIVPAIERGDEFKRRVVDAGRDVLKCADMMAEAIAMHREQRALEPISRPVIVWMPRGQLISPRAGNPQNPKRRWGR